MIDDDDDTLDAPDDSEEGAPLTLEAWARVALVEHGRATSSLEAVADAYADDTGEAPPSPSEVLDALAHLYPVSYDERAGRYVIHATLRYTY